MSIYYDKARELGKLLLSSEYSLRLSDADAALKANPASLVKMNEYRAYQNVIQNNLKKGAVTDDELELVNARIAEMAAELKRDPVISDLLFAENAYNQFVGRVFGILKSTLDGEHHAAEACGNCGAARRCH